MLSEAIAAARLRAVRETIELFAQERRARWFFGALAQSALGTGAGYVALLLIAYDRWHSPWAITLILLADLLPAMLLGPVFGAAADRWSRKRCVVVAVVLRFGTPEQLAGLNGATFGLSAIVLGRLAFGHAPTTGEAARPSLFREALQGLAATAGMPGIRALLGVSAGALFFAGLFNVAELPFADDILDSGEVGYSVLATVFGAGFIAGSLTGTAGAAPLTLKHRFGLGLLVLGAGFVATGLAPGFAVALAAFALGGFGNGMVIVYERQLIQAAVPDRLAGRIFGMKDALSAWGFGLAFVSAGALITLIGVRELLVAAGVGALLSWLVARRVLADSFNEREPVGADGHVLGASADAVGHGSASQQRPD